MLLRLTFPRSFGKQRFAIVDARIANMMYIAEMLGSFRLSVIKKGKTNAMLLFGFYLSLEFRNTCLSTLKVFPI